MTFHQISASIGTQEHNIAPYSELNHLSEEGMLKTRREAVKWSLAPCNGNEDKNAICLLLTLWTARKGWFRWNLAQLC